MEILEVNGTPLTNYEVRKTIHRHFNERIGQIRENKKLKRRERHKERIEFPQELVTVENNLHMYFKQYARLKCQTEEDIQEFLVQVEPFGLTLGEKIQFVNTSPKTLVEVHLLIDNCTSRYTEDETVELLRIVDATLAKNLYLNSGGAGAVGGNEGRNEDHASSSENVNVNASDNNESGSASAMVTENDEVEVEVELNDDDDDNVSNNNGNGNDNNEKKNENDGSTTTTATASVDSNDIDLDPLAVEL